MDTDPGKDATMKNAKVDLSQPQTLEIWAHGLEYDLHLSVNTGADLYPYDGKNSFETLQELEDELTDNLFYATCLDTGERLRVCGWVSDEIEIVGPLAIKDN